MKYANLISLVRYLPITFIALGVGLFLGNAAFAQTWADTAASVDGQVVFRWGDFLASVIREQAGPLAIAAVGLVMNYAPGPLRVFLRMTQVDQLLGRAITAGINKTAGAIQGKTLAARVGNEVIERALDYAAFHAPNLFKKLPVSEWRDKIIGRLNMGENVTVDPAIQGFIDPGRG